MKVGLVSPYDYSYPGGVTTHIFHLERCFQEMGHEVRIMAPCSRQEGHVSTNLIRLGQAIPFPSGGSFARITLSPKLLFQVKRVLERERFDVIHAHEPLTPALPPIVLQEAEVPRVGTFHAFHSKPRGYFWYKPVLERWFRHLDSLIAVSKPAMDFVSRHYPGDYELIPNGVDTRCFSPETPPLKELANGKRNILFVGRLEERKGLDCLLEAYRRLKARFSDLRLVIVGPRSRLGRDYRNMSQGLDDVVFSGSVPLDMLPRYYASAFVLCAPATGEESFGMVLLEAMATGKPVVASRIDGFSQVMTHGREGLMVPPQDQDALADALAHLLSHPGQAREMGEQGRQHAQEYEWMNVAQKVDRLYQRLLS
ncbi:MAG: glycosyltransferase family 4 protein [Dehalococcoidia bacterium]|jgi:phosphatidylinositol alpha-mannosyltransferase|nr:glycosyltransferase family 4 protein [Dehalococcoidia bacterium]MDP7239930.1 glycosyltransferase family 4 protein [Dehalococcoidia bacterium]